jgi:phage terminase large subunit
MDAVPRLTSVQIEIVPREVFRPYLKRTQRWSGIVAHRRAGKTVACVQDLIHKAGTCDKKLPQFAYIAPTYGQAKDVAWNYLKEYTAGIPGMKVSESELAVTFPHNGARIRLYGAENYERLRGLYLDGVVIDEAGDIDPRAWPEVIRPALSDRAGWATFIGTPKGRNAFYKIIHGDGKDFTGALRDPDWYGAVLKASETNLVSEDELNDARKMLTHEQYLAEFQCSFDAALKGAYYGDDMTLAEKEGRITQIPHERECDTYAAWDLGMNDFTVIWVFQIVNRNWHWLKCYGNNNKDLGHYVDWVKSLPFAINEHFIPHDGAHQNRQTGMADIDFLQQRGLNCTLIPRGTTGEKLVRINATRVKFNRFYFDQAGCGERALDALRMYRAEYDERNEVLRNNPLHNWASDYADALGYGVKGFPDTPKIDLKQYDVDTSWVV